MCAFLLSSCKTIFKSPIQNKNTWLIQWECEIYVFITNMQSSICSCYRENPELPTYSTRLFPLVWALHRKGPVWGPCPSRTQERLPTQVGNSHAVSFSMTWYSYSYYNNTFSFNDPYLRKLHGIIVFNIL